MTYVDYRNNLISDDTFYPKLEAGIRWEQRQAHERLTISPGHIEYDPDGGGGVQVTAQYSYGGYREVGSSRVGRVGYHNVLFNITYSPNITTQSGANLEVGGEYKAVSGKASVSSSVTVGKASLSFVREIAFHSF